MLRPRALVFGGCGRLGHLRTGDEKRAFVAALRAPVASLRPCGLSVRPGPEVPAVTGGAESFRGPTSGVSGTHGTGAGRGLGAATPQGSGDEAERVRAMPRSLELGRARLAGARCGRRGGGRTAGGKGGGGAPVCGGSLRRVILAERMWGRSATARGGGSCPGLRVRPEWGARCCHASVQQGALLRALGGGGVGGGGRDLLRTLPPLLNTMFKRRRGTSRSHGARAARPPGPRSPWT